MSIPAKDWPVGLTLVRNEENEHYACYPETAEPVVITKAPIPPDDQIVRGNGEQEGEAQGVGEKATAGREEGTPGAATGDAGSSPAALTIPPKSYADLGITSVEAGEPWVELSTGERGAWLFRHTPQDLPLGSCVSKEYGPAPEPVPQPCGEPHQCEPYGMCVCGEKAALPPAEAAPLPLHAETNGECWVAHWWREEFNREWAHIHERIGTEIPAALEAYTHDGAEVMDHIIEFEARWSPLIYDRRILSTCIEVERDDYCMPCVEQSDLQPKRPEPAPAPYLPMLPPVIKRAEKREDRPICGKCRRFRVEPGMEHCNSIHCLPPLHLEGS